MCKNNRMITFLSGLALGLFACKSLSSPALTVTPAPPLASISAPGLVATPTPTPTYPPVGEPVFTPEVEPPTKPSEIEMHIPDVLDPAGEECVEYFPFVEVPGGERVLIKGEGRIDCHFQHEFCGEACVTMHMVSDYDVAVDGEVLPATDSGSAAKLHVVLTLDGSMAEYFSDYPPDAVMFFTEDTPFKFEGAAPLSLDFDYVVGATFTLTQEVPTIDESASSTAAAWMFVLR